METLSVCPVCGSSGIAPFLYVPDHFLTKETFLIQQCNCCGLKFVNPRPAENEIGRYYQTDEYISHNAEKNDLTSTIYKIARHVSIRKKYGLLNKKKNIKTVLDIGCGTGEFLNYCQSKNMKICGQEPNSNARNFAIQHNHLQVYATLGDVENTKEHFDCITMWHVLEHIHSLNETLTIIKGLLKPTGELIIAVPNCNSWDAEHYLDFWAAYDVPRHLYHFNSSSLNALMAGHGFEIVKKFPQKLDAFYISLLSEKYHMAHNPYLNAVIKGWQSNYHAITTKSGYSSIIYLLTLKIP
ncbi:MAG: class I SAM-dependent methyltransferase [Bacteroidales bacterium]|nr:class I SAM-dependent methyltransferase [Bacteroidales bacterium]